MAIVSGHGGPVANAFIGRDAGSAGRGHCQNGLAPQLWTGDMPDTSLVQSAAADHAASMKFRSRVELHGKNATGLPVPPDTMAALGAGGRPAVVVTLRDHTYRTTVGTMSGQKLLPLSAENRAAAGVVAGEEVEVDIELDNAARDVEVPDDLAAALAADPQAGTFFAGLTASQRREWVRWVTEAKQESTRTRRLATTTEALHSGRKSH